MTPSFLKVPLSKNLLPFCVYSNATRRDMSRGSVLAGINKLFFLFATVLPPRRFRLPHSCYAVFFQFFAHMDLVFSPSHLVSDLCLKLRQRGFLLVCLRLYLLLTTMGVPGLWKV